MWNAITILWFKKFKSIFEVMIGGLVYGLNRANSCTKLEDFVKLNLSIEACIAMSLRSSTINASWKIIFIWKTAQNWMHFCSIRHFYNTAIILTTEHVFSIISTCIWIHITKSFYDEINSIKIICFTPSVIHDL